MRIWLLLFLRPFAQAVFMAISTLTITHRMVVQTAVAVFLLNLCWWYNTRANQDTRHLRAAGLVYAFGFTSGVLLGMWLFPKVT